MRHNPKLNVKIKLVPGADAPSWHRPVWLHVEWFRIGGCKPRKYVDRIWLAADEAEATPVEPFRAKGLADDARALASNDGLGGMKAVYLAKTGRKWAPTTLKQALAAEEADRERQLDRAAKA